MHLTDLWNQQICFTDFYVLSKRVKNNIWASMRENLSSGGANNTGTDHFPHLRSLISASFIQKIISKLATSKMISICRLATVAEQVGLNLPSSETMKTGFVTFRTICSFIS